MRLFYWVLVGAALLSPLSGCRDTPLNYMEMALPGQMTSGSLATLLSPSAGNFYRNGFPTDLRRSPEGTLRIDDFPRQVHWLTRHYVNRIQEQGLGYPTVMPVYLPFANPIDLTALPTWDGDFAQAQSPIQLLDVDVKSPQYGRRFPLQVTMTRHADSYRPLHLLQVIPTLGITLRPNTTYALLVTDRVPLAAGLTWQQHPQLAAALLPDSTLSAPVRAVYAPLRHYLQEQAIDPATVMGATVWTTGDPAAPFRRAAEQVAQQAEALTELPVSALEAFDDYPEYCVVRGYVELPGYQTGVPPYVLFGGAVTWGTDGAPLPQYTRSAEFVLTIPKQTAMPEGGFPLLTYVHGAGGRACQVYDRGEFDHLDPFHYPYYMGKAGEGPAQIAAERGWASSGLAGHSAYDHISQWGGLNGMLVYNLFNPVGLAGNYMTMAWERIYFRRIVERIEVDRGLCPEAEPGPGQTHFRFDAGMEVNLGQSQGNWISALMVGADPRPYQGVIFSGAAGTWIRLFNNNPGFELAMNSAVINRIPLQNLDDGHPFLMLVQWLLGGVDTVTNLDGLMDSGTKAPPHVIGFSGYNDYLLGDTTQRPFFMTLGSDLAGEDIGSSDQRRFMPHITLAGSEQLAYPVAGNSDTAGFGLRTNVVMRYRGDNPALLYNGHEVLFQSEAIKHQYGCFLWHLAEGVVPVVDVGYAQGGDCTQ